MSGEIAALARFAAEAQPSGDAERATRVLLLDTLGVALGGSIAPEVGELARRLDGGPGAPAAIVGRRERMGELASATVNGVAATWLDFDSGHRHPPGVPLLPAHHPAVHLVPAILAVAEAGEASVGDAIAAMFAGFEVAARLGVACRLHAEVHPHGSACAVGAAVAAARMLGTDAAGIERAIGLAAGLTLFPPFSAATAGATVRNVFAGHGARSGVLAARLARTGVTPHRDAIGTVFGRIASPSLDRDALVDGLGEVIEIDRGYFKPFPACRYAHPAIEAAAALRGDEPVVPEAVERIEVHTYALAATLTERAPATELAARFSIPHAVASMLVRGSAGPADFRVGDGLADPDIATLAARTSVIEDPKLTAASPAQRPARIMVALRDGSTRVAAVERSGGGPDAPWDTDDVLRKFLSVASEALDEGQAQALADAVLERDAAGAAGAPLRELVALGVPA